MKKYVRAVLLIVIFGAAAAGGYWLYSSRIAPTQATANSSYRQVVTVRQGSLSTSLSVVGGLEATESEDLSFRFMNGTAKLAKLAVSAGQTVQKGQVLASIDSATYQQALDQAKSDLQAAEKKLAELKTPATALQLAQSDLALAKARYQVQSAQNALDDLLHPDMAKLQSAVADARSALAKAQADLLAKQQDAASTDQLDKLRTAEATPAATYSRLASETYSDAYYQDRLQLAYNKMMDAQDARATYEIQQQANLLSAQTQVRKAEQALAKAQEALADAQAGGDKLALAKAQLAVREGETALASAEQSRQDLEAGTDATELAAAQADVDKKRLAVSTAETALAGTQLTASFNGTVTKVNVNANDTVGSGTAILTVANLKTLQVEASVDETSIRRVATGQTAQITFDAFTGQTFQGKVLSVPLQGTLQNNVMVYQVPVSLEGAEKLPLLVGMTANVKILVDEAKNALLVPTIALQKVNNMYQVQVLNGSDPNGSTTTVPVEVGLSDGTNTQIKKGLNVGDKVVVQVASTSTTGQSGPGGSQVFFGGPMMGDEPAGPKPVLGK